MAWTLQARLWAIAALAGLTLVGVIVIDGVMTRRFEHDLGAIEGDYVPMLRYGPGVAGAVETLRREIQDAVAAQDREALAAARQTRSEIQAMLERAPRVIPPESIALLREELDTWSDRALDLAVRLIEGDSGEDLLGAMEGMQEAQRELESTIAETVFLDESALEAAFANVRGAHRTASITRLVAFLALFSLVAGLAILLGRRVLGAIGELQSAFQRFGAGRFSEAVVIEGRDELAELAAGANQMATRIGELQAGLTTKQVALEAANRELESFSYSVSHDLRAPLRGIDGFSQALLEDYQEVLDDTGRDYLGRVRRAAQRMGELIDDLLMLSRIGRAEVERSPIDLTDITTRITAELTERAPERQIDWVIARELSAVADRRLITVALENLLGNAWKFTSKRERARIELGSEMRDGEVVYFVRDDGAGFDPAYAEKLFGAFQRLHGATEFEGTGIGLATVNRIIGKHGGRIWAEGKVDGGATFYFTLSPPEDAHGKLDPAR